MITVGTHPAGERTRSVAMHAPSGLGSHATVICRVHIAHHNGSGTGP